MLQQTQTNRVSEKFIEFIEEFPDFKTLMNAPLESILKVWQGLGYNKRAIALKEIATKVIEDYKGELPLDIEILQSFPQIGYNTACSIISFAYNHPTFFIETNIRRVYIYFFFPGSSSVTDKEILPLVKETMDTENPREWYYALMDYGVMLKKTHPELNKRSAHYRRQSNFKGSRRELRGKILRYLLEQSNVPISGIVHQLKENSEKIYKILEQLQNEGFLKIKGKNVIVAQ
ncbi:MAG: A/G-specific adenine glycosylase [Candidatus Lokiarchaeota archaeon]|jgi:A/G-specific adenine glycosylase